MSAHSKYSEWPKGDRVSPTEGDLDDAADLRSRCASVCEVVMKRMLPFDRALDGYEVSPEQLLGYLLMTNKTGLKMKLETPIIVELMGTVVRIVMPVDERGEQYVHNLQKLTEGV